MRDGIGNDRRRVEDPPLLRGQGRYAGDLSLPGMTHLVTVRSPLGRARIDGIDVAAARALPGVLAVWTAGDLPAGARAVAEDFVPGGLERFPRPVLAAGEVRYTGEILAAVIAESAEAAADAAELVGLDLEPLPAAASVEAAIAPGAPAVQTAVPDNLAFTGEEAFGDIETAFARAPVVVRRRLHLPRIQGGAMEPRATTATPRGPGIRVWTSTQSVFSVRARIARALDLAEPAVEVLAENVGGGFGPKGRTYPEEILTALAAYRLHRPVRWVADRSEDSASTVHAHGTVFDLELAAERDGEAARAAGEFWHDAGAYASIGAAITGNVAAHLLSGYRHPALRVRYHAVFTDATPTGTVRGGGRPEGNFAIERMMDALADQVGVSRVEVRRRNLIRPETMPYPTGLRRGPAPMVYDGGDYPRLLEEAVGRIGEPSAAPPGLLRGVGVSFGVESTGFGSGEPARVRLLPDGTAELHLGSTPQGQGHETFAAQVLVERLSWPLDRVRVFAGDTRGISGGGVTAGSRSAVHVGSATSVTAVAVRDELLRRAGERLEVAPQDLALERGVVSVRGVPQRTIAAVDLLDGEPMEVAEPGRRGPGRPGRPPVTRRRWRSTPRPVRCAFCGTSWFMIPAARSTRAWSRASSTAASRTGSATRSSRRRCTTTTGSSAAASFLDYTLASAPEIAFVPEPGVAGIAYRLQPRIREGCRRGGDDPGTGGDRLRDRGGAPTSPPAGGARPASRDPRAPAGRDRPLRPPGKHRPGPQRHRSGPLVHQSPSCCARNGRLVHQSP